MFILMRKDEKGRSQTVLARATTAEIDEVVRKWVACGYDVKDFFYYDVSDCRALAVARK